MRHFKDFQTTFIGLKDFQIKNQLSYHGIRLKLTLSNNIEICVIHKKFKNLLS